MEPRIAQFFETRAEKASLKGNWLNNTSTYNSVTGYRNPTNPAKWPAKLKTFLEWYKLDPKQAMGQIFGWGEKFKGNIEIGTNIHIRTGHNKFYLEPDSILSHGQYLAGEWSPQSGEFTENAEGERRWHPDAAKARRLRVGSEYHDIPKDKRTAVGEQVADDLRTIVAANRFWEPIEGYLVSPKGKGLPAEISASLTLMDAEFKLQMNEFYQFLEFPPGFDPQSFTATRDLKAILEKEGKALRDRLASSIDIHLAEFRLREGTMEISETVKKDLLELLDQKVVPRLTGMWPTPLSLADVKERAKEAMAEQASRRTSAVAKNIETTFASDKGEAAAWIRTTLTQKLDDFYPLLKAKLEPAHHSHEGTVIADAHEQAARLYQDMRAGLANDFTEKFKLGKAEQDALLKKADEVFEKHVAPPLRVPPAALVEAELRRRGDRANQIARDKMQNAEGKTNTLYRDAFSSIDGASKFILEAEAIAKGVPSFQVPIGNFTAGQINTDEIPKTITSGVALWDKKTFLAIADARDSEQNAPLPLYSKTRGDLFDAFLGFIDAANENQRAEFKELVDKKRSDEFLKDKFDRAKKASAVERRR